MIVALEQYGSYSSDGKVVRFEDHFEGKNSHTSEQIWGLCDNKWS